MAESGDIAHMIGLLQSSSDQERVVAAQRAVGAIPDLTAADQVIIGAVLIASGLANVDDGAEADAGFQAAFSVAVRMREVLRASREPKQDDGIGAFGVMQADPYVIRAGEQP